MFYCNQTVTRQGSTRRKLFDTTSEDFESSICYVDGNADDRKQAEDISDLSESVWEAVRPPQRIVADHTPLITARKIEVIRRQMKD